MSPQSEGRSSTDRRLGDGAYNTRGGYRQTGQNMEESHRQAGQANGYGQADASKQRFMGPPLAPGDTHSPNGSTNHSPIDGRNGRGREMTQDMPLRERSRTNGAAGGKSHTVRLCQKCNEPLTGQFVRALGGTFHLECFKCRVCPLCCMLRDPKLTMVSRTADW